MRINKEAFAGLMFLAFGLAGLGISSQYRLGSALDMGPGYFPLLLSCAIAGLGALITARAVWASSGEPGILSLSSLRPFVFILGSVVLFGLCLEPLGLVPTIFISTLAAWLARPDGRLREFVAMTAILIAIAFLVFVYGLNMSLELWPDLWTS